MSIDALNLPTNEALFKINNLEMNCETIIGEVTSGSEAPHPSPNESNSSINIRSIVIEDVDEQMNNDEINDKIYEKIHDTIIDEIIDKIDDKTYDTIDDKIDEKIDEKTVDKIDKKLEIDAIESPGASPINKSLHSQQTSPKNIISNSPTSGKNKILHSPPTLTKKQILNSPILTKNHILNSPILAKKQILHSPILVKNDILNSPILTKNEILNSPILTKNKILNSPILTKTKILNSPISTKTKILHSPISAKNKIVNSPVSPIKNKIAIDCKNGGKKVIQVSSPLQSTAQICESVGDIEIVSITDIIEADFKNNISGDSSIQILNKNENFNRRNSKSTVGKYKIRQSSSKNSLSSNKLSMILHHFNCINKESGNTLFDKILKNNTKVCKPFHSKGQGDNKGSALEKLGLNPQFKIKQKSHVFEGLQKTIFEANLKLKHELAERTAELDNMLPRYKFLEENYQDFLLLKADFMKIKEAKIASGEYIEKNDESTQTWSTAVMCNYCVDTRAKYEDPEFQEIATAILNNNNNYYLVAREDFQSLLQSFKSLKEKVLQREEDYMEASCDIEYLQVKSLNNEKDCKIQQLEKKYTNSIKLLNIMQKIIMKIPEEMHLHLPEKEQIWLKKTIRKLKAKYPILEEEIGCFSECSFESNAK